VRKVTKKSVQVRETMRNIQNRDEEFRILRY